MFLLRWVEHDKTEKLMNTDEEQIQSCSKSINDISSVLLHNVVANWAVNFYRQFW